MRLHDVTEQALRSAVREAPQDPIIRQELSRLLLEQGRHAEAAAMAEEALAVAAELPMLRRAIVAFGAGDRRTAQMKAQERLATQPDDAAASLLLAQLASGGGILPEAERHLRRANTLLPAHVETLQRLAETLATGGSPREAIACLDDALAINPASSAAALTRLYLLAQLGEYDAARTGYDALLLTHPDNVAAWIGLGHLSKTLGDPEASIAAFRRAAALVPHSGEAWWGMADVKPRALGAGDVTIIEAALAGGQPSLTSAAQLHFALGKAHEDAANYAASFRHYDAGNQLARRARPYDPRDTHRQTDEMIGLLTPAFLAARKGVGATGRGPIFILGMPRAGSTLLEQILSSHSAIEGTSELPYVPLLAYELVAARWRDADLRTARAIAELDPADFAVLGTRYRELAAVHRHSDCPLFIDKLPDNWPLIGFIHLMLPDAIIIDARRNPLACGFGNYKQYFAQGRNFAFSQADIGAYIRDYLRLMDHVDRVLPGRVIRVDHEALLADPEPQVRRLLNAIGLPFEPACLAFHENRRPVRTASASQVRRPINAAGTALWRHYQPWLGELTAALGPLARD